jgi:hypothetical protein
MTDAAMIKTKQRDNAVITKVKLTCSERESTRSAIATFEICHGKRQGGSAAPSGDADINAALPPYFNIEVRAGLAHCSIHRALSRE